MSYRILHIDDDTRFSKQFGLSAVNYGFEVEHDTGLEEGIIRLKENFELFHLVVCDGKGYLSEDKRNPTYSHVQIALREMEMLRSRGKLIPFIILTGYLGDLKDHLESLPDYAFVFDKGEFKPEHFFGEMESIINKFPAIRNRLKHKELFEIFQEKLLDEDTQQEFEVLVNRLETSELDDRKSIFGKARTIQEAIYKSINSHFPEILPNNFFKLSNDMLDFNRINKHLSGNKDHDEKGNLVPTTEVFQDDHIYSMASTIYWTCGAFLHKVRGRKRNLTDYGVKSIIYALFELLLWYKDLVNQQQKKKR